MTSTIEDSPDDDDDDGNSLEKIFFELGYRERLDILLRLCDNKAKLSSLSKDLNLPMPEVHRNITRLQNAGLIKKESEGILSLSPFSIAVVKQIPTFRFLVRHMQYFSQHSLGELPERFAQSLGVLENGELVTGYVHTNDLWARMIKSSHEFLYLVTPIVLTYFAEMIFMHVRENGINFRYIMPEKTARGEEYELLRKKYGVYELLAKKVIERREVDSVKVAIAINEKQAAVSFPDDRGEPDFANIFFSEDKLFREWCLDYFHYRWNNSDLSPKEIN